MKVNINLLPEKAKLKFDRFRKLSRVKTVSVLAAIGCFLFFAFVLAYNIKLKKENINLDLRLKGAEKRIEDKKEVELQAFLLKKRASQISKILKERKSISRVLWEIFSLLPSGALIQRVEADDQLIEIAFSASSYFEASDFIDNFPREEIGKLGGKSVDLSSFTKDEGGNYSVGFKIKF